MSSPEQNLWISVIKQALADACGLFDQDFIDRSYERLRQKILHPNKPKKPRKYPPKRFEEKFRHIDIRSAREWFKLGGADFRKVCDDAGFAYDIVQKKSLEIIDLIEAKEVALVKLEREKYPIPKINEKEGKRVQHRRNTKQV